MMLLIMRHGEAVSQTFSDFERHLTRRGEEQVIDNYKKFLSLQQPLPDLIITSPLVRARETTELILESCEVRIEPEVSDILVPEGQVDGVLNLLSKKVETKVCLLVSHQPLVSYLVHCLTDVEVFLETSMIVGIQTESFEPHCGEVKWHIDDYS